MLLAANMYKNSRCFLLSTEFFFFFFWPMSNNDSQRQEGIQLDLWVCVHGFNQSQAENVIWPVRLGLQRNMHTHFLGIIP